LSKIRAKSLKIRGKFVKIFAISLKIWANSLKYGQKWRPTLFYLKKWRPTFAESHEDLFFFFMFFVGENMIFVDLCWSS